MITVPVILFYAAGGVASAFGGWLFHRFFKLHNSINSLEARVVELEK